MRKGSYYFHLG